MMITTHLNLEKQFHDTYRDFFAQHQYVSCAPHSIRWQAGGLGHKSDFLTLLSPIHLRTFLGIDITNTDTIERGDVSFYDHKQRSFSTTSFGSLYPQSTTQFETLSSLIQEHIGIGVRISLLSETGRGHGLGFTGVWSTLLASYLLHDVDYEKDVLSLSHHIETTLRGKHSYGDRGYLALQKDTHTHLYFQKESDTFSYGGYGFDDYPPFDIALLFSGIPADVERVDTMIKHNHKRFAHLGNDIISIGQKMGIPDTHPNLTLFDQEQGYDHIINTLLVLNSMIIQGLYHLTYSHDDIHISKILDYIEDVQGLVSVINGDDFFVDTYMKLFHQHQKSLEERTAIIPAYSGKHGGGYICFSPHGSSRHTRKQCFGGLQEMFPDMYVEYLSYRDPIETISLTVRQDFSHNIYSDYIQSNSCIYQDNNGTKSIGLFDDLLAQYQSGILLDAIHNKVYINGVKATKENIKSQTTTVEVVGLLLQQGGGEVSNLSFGPSTYTRQQNQMLGKIIGPLRKIFSEQFGEELPITCTGSLRKFVMSIGTSATPLGIISKISHD